MRGATRFRAIAAAFGVFALNLAAARPVLGQAVLRVSESVSFRFGFALQVWADWTQDPATGGYAENIFIRRARMYCAGQVARRVSFFVVAVSSNVFKAPKSSSPTVFLEDAFGEVAVVQDSVLLDGGLILIPLCRDCLTQTSRLLTLDLGTFSFLQLPSTQSVSGRDVGFQAKGYLLSDRLEYRLGAYQGRRDVASKNSFRSAGRLQYNFFEVEKGQFYPGVYLGAKKVLAVGASFDTQMDYRAWDADVFLDLPMPGGSGLTVQADFIHWDGGTTFPALKKQNDFLAEAGWYFGVARLLPFLRYEQQNFENAEDRLQNRRTWQVGLTWYPLGHNLNIRGAWTLLQRPNDPATRTANQYTVQFQIFYF